MRYNIEDYLKERILVLDGAMGTCIQGYNLNEQEFTGSCNCGIPDLVKQEIAKIKPGKVYIIGLQGVLSSVVDEQVVQVAAIDKANIVRIGGIDRFATSLEVAKYFNLSGTIACVATGNNFPDALAGSIYAAENKAPILLVDKTLSNDEMTYLESKKISGITIFGGEAVVNKDIQQELSQLIGQ